jgi:hypothetical protein
MIANCPNGSKYVRMKVDSKVRKARDWHDPPIPTYRGITRGYPGLPRTALFLLFVVRVIVRSELTTYRNEVA